MKYTIRIEEWHHNQLMEWEYPYDEKAIKQVLNEVFSRQDYKKGLNYLRKIKNPVVVDLGAYVGVTPIYFSMHKGTTVYAVEPHPDTFKALVFNTQQYPNIIPVNYAIGDKTEPRSIAQELGKLGMSLYGNPGEARIPVRAITIKDLFDKYKIKHVDLLKIDVENAEYEIFLSDAFDKVKDKIDFIIGESHNDVMPYEAVRSILEGKGFTVTYLPVSNVVSTFQFKMSGNKIKTVQVLLHTMFIATK